MAQTQLGEQLRRLQMADLIRLIQSEPELEFWFKHAVIQEAVYTSLLKSTRAGLHRRVAEAIERSVPEGNLDRAGMLALHYERAGDYEPAVRYAVAAGDQARRTYALREAVGFYDRALKMIEQSRASLAMDVVCAAFSGHGTALQSLGETTAARDSYRAMLAAAQASGDALREADALNRLITTQVLLEGHTPELAENLERALALADQVNDPSLKARTHWNAGLAYRFKDPPRAIAYLEQALALAERAGPDDEKMRELQGHILNELGIASTVGGHVNQSLEYMVRAVAIFRALDHRSMLADTLGGQGWMYLLIGRLDEARRAATEGLNYSLGIENHWTASYNYITLQSVAAESGRIEEALALATKGLAGAKDIGFPAFTGFFHAQLSSLHFLLGDSDLAQEAAAASLKAFEAVGAAVWLVCGQIVAAQAALERGDAAQAWAMVAPLSELTEQRERDMEGIFIYASHIARIGLETGHIAETLSFCRWFIPRCDQEGAFGVASEVRYWYARLLATLGDWEGAESELLMARETLAAAGARLALWQVDAMLARVYAMRGADEMAAAARQRAVATVESMAADITDPNLRRRFLARMDLTGQMAA